MGFEPIHILEPSITSTEHKLKDKPTHRRCHVALIAQLGEHYTGNAKVVAPNPVQSLNIFQICFSGSAMAAFVSVIMSRINCYCWTSTAILLTFF